ncbi:MAG: aminotransferase class III-fold pyridoxal phosphate-dependent enzyme [Candidatus Bathyarchaeia archaeon]
MKTKRILTQSEKTWRKARKVIPAGTQCLSKGPTQFVDGVAPKYLKKGKGCYVWDVDGNKYLDYGMGLRSLVLGYSYPAVNEAIKKQLKDGTTFTLMHPLELELAELLIKTIPCAEAVRYGKNGSDATTAAVRAARAYTGRDKIAICGYHGWHDWYMITTDRNRGIPKVMKELSFAFKYNNIDSLTQLFETYPDQFAGVIMEPVGVTPPEGNFLKDVQKVTHDNGAVLIFDEIITGFRFSLGGAQEYFNVIPDLGTFGKAMANGMPISALVGKQEIMNVFNESFLSFTFGGETLSLAAAMATIKELKAKKVIPFLWAKGKKLQDGYDKLVKERGVEKYTQCAGYPPSTLVKFSGKTADESLLMKSLVQQELLKRGILWAAYHAISYSHKNAEIDKTLEAFDDALKVLSKAVQKGDLKKFLEGAPVKPVFREVT